MSNLKTITKPSGTEAQQQADKEAQTLLPPVDVIEDANGITLYADLPGVPKDKLTLNVEADTLTIEGEMQIDMPQTMDSTHAEVAVPRFKRTFTLSKELDTEAVSASFEKGVLQLRVPKAAHAQPRKIEIQVA